MKIQLKTSVWEERDVDLWQKKFANLALLAGLIALTNTLFNGFLGRIIPAILNALFFIAMLMINLSHNAYLQKGAKKDDEKERRREEA